MELKKTLCILFLNKHKFLIKRKDKLIKSNQYYRC